MPEQVGKDGVDLALVVDRSKYPSFHSFRTVPYAEQRSFLNVGYHDPQRPTAQHLSTPDGPSEFGTRLGRRRGMNPMPQPITKCVRSLFAAAILPLVFRQV